ncbi:MAG: DUF2878 domain-containing protein [Salinicola sp.]|uniref:DUF2878 domain-containing protein n=1 Tax=Salinicola sp. TaxID=1978524 RepID=UPI001DF69B69|nr:DUF2878 domain-containing protein [Salinicola sp.]NRB55717.1 DUF2878 domain-containing protein [Salinicola sp.]
MKDAARGGTLAINALLFQGGWFLCVLGGSLWAIAATPLILLVHWRWLARPGEWRWWLGLLLAGIVVDGTLVAAGGIEMGGALPIWLWALWLLFATTLHHCLAWLWRYRALAIACGALGGPLSYLSGAALAGVEIRPWAIGVEAIVWASLCGGVAQHLGGRRASGRRRLASESNRDEADQE